MIRVEVILLFYELKEFGVVRYNGSAQMYCTWCWWGTPTAQEGDNNKLFCRRLLAENSQPHDLRLTNL